MPALVLDLDLLSTPGVGGFTGHDIVGGFTPRRLGESNDHVGIVENSAASTEATVVVVDGDVDIAVLLASGRSVAGGGVRLGLRSGRSSRSSGTGGNWSGLRSWGDVRCLSGGWLGRFRGRLGRRSRSRNRRRGRCWGLRRSNVDAGGLLDLGGVGRSRGRGRLRRRGGSRLGLLVEQTLESSRNGLVVVVDSGEDNDGLGDDLRLGDEGALVEGRSDGEGAEEQRGEDSRGLHVDLGVLVCC